MKQETVKEIVALATIMNGSEKIETEIVRKYLQNIIRSEMNETKIGKFDLWDYAEKAGSGRPTMETIHHEGGFKISSDSHILAKIKAEYPDDMEGKNIERNGNLLDDKYHYPKFQIVIDETVARCDKTTEIDLNKVKSAIKDFKSFKKVNKYVAPCLYHIEASDQIFMADVFNKILPFMEEFNTCTLHYSDSAHKSVYLQSGENIILFMPAVLNVEKLVNDDSHRYYNL